MIETSSAESSAYLVDTQGTQPPRTEDRIREIFPDGMPKTAALVAATIAGARDVEEADEADRPMILAGKVRAQREDLENMFFKTKVRPNRDLIRNLILMTELVDATNAPAATSVEDATVSDSHATADILPMTAASVVAAPEPTVDDFKFYDESPSSEDTYESPAILPIRDRREPTEDTVRDPLRPASLGHSELPLPDYTIENVAAAWTEFIADKGNATLRNKLAAKYLPIVKYNAERIYARLPEGVELDDLITGGTFGLLDAIDAFDVSRGVKFETYCVPRIRGAILDELRVMDWVPRLVRSKASKLNEARSILDAKLGREPTVEELASHMEMSVRDLEAMAKEANAVGLISLDKKWYETDSYKDVREIDILEDKKGEQADVNLKKIDTVRMATKGLNRNERLIIILYYFEELTMKEIGSTLGLSESRVSQMHSAIIERLQKMYPDRVLWRA